MVLTKIFLIRGLAFGALLLAGILFLFSLGSGHAVSDFYFAAVITLMGLVGALNDYFNLARPVRVPEALFSTRIMKLGPIMLRWKVGPGQASGEKRTTKILLGIDLLLMVLGASDLVYRLLKYNQHR